MSHEPTLATRAWAIAAKHVPHLDIMWAPNRNAILAAVTEALREAPPPTAEFDGLLADIDRADARQGAGS